MGANLQEHGQQPHLHPTQRLHECLRCFQSHALTATPGQLQHPKCPHKHGSPSHMKHNFEIQSRHHSHYSYLQLISDPTLPPRGDHRLLILQLGQNYINYYKWKIWNRSHQYHGENPGMKTRELDCGNTQIIKNKDSILSMHEAIYLNMIAQI